MAWVITKVYGKYNKVQERQVQVDVLDVHVVQDEVVRHKSSDGSQEAVLARGSACSVVTYATVCVGTANRLGRVVARERMIWNEWRQPQPCHKYVQ